MTQTDSESSKTDDQASKDSDITTASEANQSPQDDAAESNTKADMSTIKAAKSDQGKLKQGLNAYWQHKLWTLPLSFLIIVSVVMIIPTSRYPLLALIIKRPFSVMVVDSKTAVGVSGATVTIDGHQAITDSAGKVTIEARVGKRSLTVSKKYFQSVTTGIFVGLGKQSNGPFQIAMLATGRQVHIKVIDKITTQPVSNATVRVLGTDTKTDVNGQATIVLPTNAPSQATTIQADGYNSLNSNIAVTDKVISSNTFVITPAGRIYFLSNLSGQIDVVATNLDGSDRKVVLAGTGKEDAASTVLLASRDWKYLALLSRRDGGDHAKLFLITTGSGLVSTIDSSSADFNLVGWSDHFFVYRSDHLDQQPWQPNRSIISSFNADNGKTTALANTNANGSDPTDAQYEGIDADSLLGNALVYIKNWYNFTGSSGLSGKQNTLNTIGVDGSNAKTPKSVDATQFNLGRFNVAKPDQLYFSVDGNGSSANNYYRLDGNGNITQSSTITADTVNQIYPTYLVSPSSKQVFWSEVRDGKNTLFVGDYNTNNSKQIASLSDYTQYGWFTDSYLLVEKDKSELYIIPADGGTALKISDYYKPQQTFYGYGGGYGGL